jgi:hypothetical protein
MRDRGPYWPIDDRTAGQSEEMGPDYDYDAPDSVYGLPYEDFPDFEPNFRSAVVHPRHPVTDLLVSVPIPPTGCW